MEKIIKFFYTQLKEDNSVESPSFNFSIVISITEDWVFPTIITKNSVIIICHPFFPLTYLSTLLLCVIF